MYLASRKVLAILLVIGVCSLVPSMLKAQNYNQCCPKPTPPPVQCCPAPVLEKPTPCPAVTCCPVDPKEVRKAQKEADHAAHEAAEACRRQQKAAEKAQRKIDEEFAEQQAKIEKANEKLAQRNAEFAQANQEYASLTGAACCAAPTATETVVEITPVPQPEEPVIQSKVEPLPLPQEKPVIQETPPAAPTPEAPRHLPKTASPMGLIGLIGLASMSGYLTRFFRR